MLLSLWLLRLQARLFALRSVSRESLGVDCTATPGCQSLLILFLSREFPQAIESATHMRIYDSISQGTQTTSPTVSIVRIDWVLPLYDSARPVKGWCYRC